MEKGETEWVFYLSFLQYKKQLVLLQFYFIFQALTAREPEAARKKKLLNHM